MRSVPLPTEMTQMQQKFKAVDIHTFRNVTRDINFDVYIKISDDNMAHVFSKTTGLDYKRLAQYIQKGVTELYIRQEDDLIYKNFISITADSIINDPHASAEKKIATLLNMTEQNMSELFTQFNVAEETANKAQKVVKNYIHLMSESPKTLTIILQLVSHGEYLYYHSIAVSIFSMLIAKASGQFKQNFLETIGMGGFLHDIGCTQLPKEILTSSKELSREQWKEMRSHPQIGLKMIENTPSIPEEVKFIVYQHHEKIDSRGYPNGLAGNAIYYPAKTVAIADCFSALISNRPFRAAYTVPQAIKVIQNEAGHFDKDLAKLLPILFLR